MEDKLKVIGDLYKDNGYGSQNGRAYDARGGRPAIGHSHFQQEKWILEVRKIKGYKKKINYVEISQPVRVRAHKVNCEALCKCLRAHKTKSNKEIAEDLGVPITEVEHWFRRDKYQSIPNATIWHKLKVYLQIQTSEFDRAITEYIEKPGVFEKASRLYFCDMCSPTLTANEMFRIIEVNICTSQHKQVE